MCGIFIIFVTRVMQRKILRKFFFEMPLHKQSAFDNAGERAATMYFHTKECF
jgi:hypothetical protein